MHPAAAIDHRQLTDSLSVSTLMPGASEAHGMLCGLICVGEPAPERRWLKELLAEVEPQDLRVQEAAESLRSLADQTRSQMDGPGAGFTPLLPAETASLRERALALYDWTRGFLFGVGVAGVDAADLSTQAREAFDDFTAITHMDLDALAEGEENERSLTELQEFIWVAAMVIHDECDRREDSA